MKNKPGPKIKSFSERTHQKTFYYKGHEVEKFGDVDTMFKWLHEQIRLFKK